MIFLVMSRVCEPKPLGQKEYTGMLFVNFRRILPSVILVTKWTAVQKLWTKYHWPTNGNTISKVTTNIRLSQLESPTKKGKLDDT